jgi:hypothetical protein
VSAYLGTHYVVDEGDCRPELRVGERCDDLLRLLRRGKSPGAAFITASNPKGREVGDDLNRHANLLLEADLKTVADTVLGGRGIGPDESWEPEQSFLAVGLTFDQAIHIGRHYDQNGIVWAEEDCIPRLVLLR